MSQSVVPARTLILDNEDDSDGVGEIQLPLHPPKVGIE